MTLYFIKSSVIGNDIILHDIIKLYTIILIIAN